MGTFRRRRLGAVVLLMVAVASCAGPPLEHGDRAVHYDDIGELVASANAVAIGRVAATSRGRVLDQEDVVFTIMDVRVVVERLLAGQMPTGAFTIEQPGWEKTARRLGWRGWFDAAGERPWRLQDELRLTEGDRGVFFLAGDRPPTGWELLGPEGLYLIDGPELIDTVRSDPTVRRVEALTVAQLEGPSVAPLRLSSVVSCSRRFRPPGSPVTASRRLHRTLRPRLCREVALEVGARLR
jgi:hypothetical protein